MGRVCKSGADATNKISSRATSGRNGFTIESVIIALGICAIAALAAVSLFNSVEKGTLKPKIIATMSTLEESLQSALRDKVNYQNPAILDELKKAPAALDPHKLRFPNTIQWDLKTTDIDGNDVYVASSNGVRFFKANGRKCSREYGSYTDPYPANCPIRVILDVLHTLDSTSAVAYQIQVDPTVLHVAPLGYVNATNPNVFPSASSDPLILKYPYAIPQALYRAATSKADCSTSEYIGMMGIDSAGKAVCLRKDPNKCNSDEELVSLLVVNPADMLGPQLQTQCKKIISLKCPDNYALTKYPGKVTTGVYSQACRFITPADVAARPLQTTSTVKAMSCPLKFYDANTDNFDCLPQGGAPASEIIKQVAAGNPALPNTYNVAICTFADKSKVQNGWSVQLLTNKNICELNQPLLADAVGI